VGWSRRMTRRISRLRKLGLAPIVRVTRGILAGFGTRLTVRYPVRSDDGAMSKSLRRFYVGNLRGTSKSTSRTIAFSIKGAGSLVDLSGYGNFKSGCLHPSHRQVPSTTQVERISLRSDMEKIGRDFRRAIELNTSVPRKPLSE
jgi:hypothetical protein